MKKCPRCGGKLADIIYGLPSSEAFELEEKKEVYLGGCSIIIGIEQPKYYCYSCDCKYYKNLTSADEEDVLIPDELDTPAGNRYIFVQYYDDLTEDFEGRSYSYKSDLDLEIGDYVEVERTSQKVIGIITDIDYFNDEDAPYPYDKLKSVIRKIDPVELRSDSDWKNIETKESRNLILNTMFGKLQIKRFIELLRDKHKWKDVNDLYYYPKFNTFFYKDAKYSAFFHAEYETEVITQSMYFIILKDSIKVEIPKEGTADNELYVIARQFCIDNNIDYYDDTDILEYTDEKRQFYNDKASTYVEPKDYTSIDEIIEDLENYEPTKYIEHDPPYYVEGDDIIHIAGFIDYPNSRIFNISKFLRDNNYVDDKYYDRERYPELFEEQWDNYNYEKLDRKRLSYMILRSFNVERIAEGTIDHLCRDEYMLRAVKRLKELGPIKDDETIDEDYEIYDEDAIIDLSIKMLDKIKYKDIIMMSFAEPGAMGEPGGIIFLLNNLKAYHTNYCYDGMDIKNLYSIFPPLETIKCGFHEVKDLDDNWDWLDMGFGNYLFIRKDIYDDYVKLVEQEITEEPREGHLYNRWIELAEQLLSNK